MRDENLIEKCPLLWIKDGMRHIKPNPNFEFVVWFALLRA
jgi:hypothetical protein